MQFNKSNIKHNQHTRARKVSIRNQKYKLFPACSVEVPVGDRCNVVIKGRSGSGKTIALVVCLVEILSQLKKPLKGNKIYIECDTEQDVTFELWLSECLFDMDFWKPKFPIEPNIRSIRNVLREKGIHTFNSNSRFAKQLEKQPRPENVELWIKVDDNPLSSEFGSRDLNLKTIQTVSLQKVRNSTTYGIFLHKSLRCLFQTHVGIEINKIVEENDENCDLDKISISGTVERNKYGMDGEVFTIAEI